MIELAGCGEVQPLAVKRLTAESRGRVFYVLKRLTFRRLHALLRPVKIASVVSSIGCEARSSRVPASEANSDVRKEPK
jgi:hypothetical protein